MMIQQNEIEKVKLIATLIGLQAAQIMLLARGATSVAYRVDDDQSSIIVRFIPAGTNRPVTYQSEFTILRMLQANGCPVPTPILTSAETNVSSPIIEPWAVTSIVDGTAIRKMSLSPAVASELGSFLKVLHTLPVTGFGRLYEERERLHGQQTNPIAGICARWCWAPLWPFDGSELHAHPIATYAPELISKLMSIRDTIDNLVNEDRAVLNHADLHGEHIFVCADKVTGIIDFGAAVISIPAWDFAVIAFHHGWPACQAVLHSYTDHVNGDHLLARTEKAAIILALYKIAKAVQSSAGQTKVAKIVRFLSDVLQEC